MATDLATILQLRVPVIVQIGRSQKTMDDVLSLSPGAIIELDKSVEQDLDLLINNKSIGSGVAVKVGENFGLRIKQVGSANQLIEAMGE